MSIDNPSSTSEGGPGEVAASSRNPDLDAAAAAGAESRPPVVPDITRPASFRDQAPPASDTAGTFDIEGAEGPPPIPVALFKEPPRVVGGVIVNTIRKAPNLQVAGDPRRSAKLQVQYIKQLQKALNEALQRL